MTDDRALRGALAAQAPLNGAATTATGSQPPYRASTASLLVEAVETTRLAVPLAVTQVGQLAMFTTDLAFLGRLGDATLAAAALAHTILFAAFIVGMGLVSAVAPMTAQALGAGDRPMVRRSLRVGLHASLLLGLPLIVVQLQIAPLLMALDQPPEVVILAETYLATLSWSIVPAWGFMALRGYMSALGKAGPGLWIMAAGVLVNAGLAYLLIFGGFGIPPLGLIGAGLATTFVNTAMCVAALVIVARVSPFSDHAPLVRFWKPDAAQSKRLVWIGLPIAVAFSLEHGLFTASNLMAGTLGASALASHQIALQIASIAFMVPFGFGMAASVRVGAALGAGRMADARRAGFVALAIGIIMTGLTTLATILFADVIPVVFLGPLTPATAPTHALSTVLLVYAAAFFVVDGLQTIANGALRGLSDTRIPMVMAAVSFWGLGFPLCWWLAFSLELETRGIWIGLCAGLAVYAALLVVRFALVTRPVRTSAST